MPVGGEIRRDDGVIQIEGNRGNYMLRDKQTITPNIATPGTTAYTYELVVTNAVAPVVALTCGDYATVCLKSISGTTWTFRIFCQSTAPVTYYLFDVYYPTASTFGLQVFDGSGRLIFDALHKPKRVTALHLAPVAGTAWTLTAGRSYAFLPARGGGHIDQTFSGPSNQVFISYFANACRNTAPHTIERANLLYSFQTYSQGNVPTYTAYNVVGDWMLIDVTGY